MKFKHISLCNARRMMEFFFLIRDDNESKIQELIVLKCHNRVSKIR